MAAPSSTPSTPVDVPALSPVFVGTLKCRIFDTTLGAKYYTANGIAITPAQLGFSQIHSAFIVHKNATTTTFLFQYDVVNSCIRAYIQSDSDNNLPLIEVPDSDTAFAGTEIVRATVFGV